MDESQEIFKKNVEKVNDYLTKQKEKHKEEINKLWNNNFLTNFVRESGILKTDLVVII